jgi:hypothetical protein
MNAAHAGIVKQLSKEIDENDRYNWEKENMDTMKELLIEKSNSCAVFRDCLLMNKKKVLADCTYNKMWGTGLSKWLTEATKPDYWPGTNQLGALLMDISEEMEMPPTNTDNMGDVMTNASDEDISDEDNGEHDEEEETITTDNQKSQVNTSRTRKENNRENPKDSGAPNEKDKKANGQKKGKKNPNTNHTNPNSKVDGQTKGKFVDIRSYLDPQTGKRKTLRNNTREARSCQESGHLDGRYTDGSNGKDVV